MSYVIYVALVALGAGAVALLRCYPRRTGPFIAFGLFCAISVPSLYVSSTGRGTPFGDFDKAYYPAGRLAITTPAALYDCAHSDGLCFVNLPILALLFTPVSVLPLPVAHTVAVVVSIAAVAAAIWLLIRLAEAAGWRRYAVIALVLLNGPLYYSLRLANLTHVVLALVTFAMLRLLVNADGRAGVVLAIAALIKPPLLIWLAYAVLRRRWRCVLSMTAALLVMVGASLALFGVALHATWLHQFVAGTSARPVGAYNVQSISGFLIRLTTSGTLVNWHPITVGTGFRIVQYALSGLVIGVAVVSGKLGGQPTTAAAWIREFTAVLCVVLLVSPISWTHYYCLLLIPMAAYSTGALAVPHDGPWVVATGCAFLLVGLPVALWVPAHPLYGAIVARILLSHYVFGCALLLCVLALAQARTQDREQPAAGAVHVGTASASSV